MQLHSYLMLAHCSIQTILAIAISRCFATDSGWQVNIARDWGECIGVVSLDLHKQSFDHWTTACSLLSRWSTRQCTVINNYCFANYLVGRRQIVSVEGVFITIFMELTAQKGKGNRGKTSDCARTWDLCSIAEFQPSEPRRPVEILCPPSLLCTGYRCTAIQRHLRRRWACYHHIAHSTSLEAQVLSVAG